jgi:hypothetical protein
VNNLVFNSSYTWNPDRIHALAIYCSDGRWGLSLDEFCYRGLDIPRYDRFVVPGGPVWLNLRHIDLLCPYDAARDQLSFLVEAHQLERIVLIAHYGCAFYARLLGKDPEGCLPAQEEDLQAAAKTLRAWFAGIEVEGYMAMREGDSLRFHTVEL